ncbi:potassium transporter [Mycolicibacterium sp. P9-22]|uniref:potassium transporter n=1 Tax=Mycolicibacterium sp. P9-22 TaxID=2024613 RepID=UPI0011EDA668|nr:potassium transporter [Mycolicibacterium sp. P9-22]KAA0113046.1 potassium transporter [Mycolicibacterium sp. P9-22]
MVAVESCDVCIVGAGLTGINALFVASRYLRPDQKVILLDRRKRTGGMWVDVYPYVRLHQPHAMFTAGNIKWTLDRDPGYLATKDEVLDHFEHCLDEIGRRVRVEERYGWSFLSDTAGEHGGVRITCRADTGEERVIEAPRLIKAYGFGINPNEPLTVSSSGVRSVSPDYCDMRSGEIADSDAPVWIIGSGKTAMDTAHTLITRRPGREVNLVAGSGTYFTNRDRFFPTGARRWWAGNLISNLGAEFGRRFDGSNEAEVAQWYRQTHGTGPTEQAENFMLGVLSEHESDTVAQGLNEVVMDHLVDVVDRDGAVEMVLHDGGTRLIPPGSWLVNCTGYLAVDEMPYEPYTSADGAVLSINTRSATMHLTSYAGYFMTHLMFQDKLTSAPLYELDVYALQKRCKASLAFAMFTLVQHNLSVIADELPAKVFSECGLDFDKWYPWHRRTAAGLNFLRTHRAQRQRFRCTLDTLRERFDLRCGPLDPAVRASGAAAG